MTIVAGIVVIALPLLISAFGIYGIARGYRAAKDSEYWPCIRGKLLKCELIQRRKGTHDVFNLDVKYSYHVDGEILESTKVMFYFPQWSTSRTYYVNLQKTLAKTSDLRVYVDPNNPRQSILFPGSGQAPGWLLPTACIMMLVCPISGILAVYILFFH